MYPRKNNKQNLTASNEKSSNKKYYSDKEQESKKKLIVVKVLEDLKKRHKKLIERYNFSDIFLKQNLNNLIKDENLMGFDYSSFLNKAEQEVILDNLINTNSTNNYPDNSFSLNHDERIGRNKNLNLNKNGMNYIENILDDKNNYNSISPKNNTNNNNNVLNYNYSKAKYEELKNVKEKDEWGILAKRNYMEYLEDKISKIQQKEEKKKEITDILAKQVLEKNQQKQIKLTSEEKYFENLNKDVENWKKSEAQEKEKVENKIKDFIEKRDNVMKSKLEIKMQEEKVKKEMEKEFLNKIEYEKLQDLNTKLQKKLQNKQILNDQLEQAKANENFKKQKKIMDYEEGKIFVEKYEGLLDSKDKERLDIKLSIQEKAKIRDIRENHSMNVKKLKDMIENEFEHKYRKEKEEIERKNNSIEQANFNKRKNYIESMKQSYDEQQMQKKNQKFNEKLQDRKYYEENLVPQLQAFRQEQFNLEKQRIENIKKYKEELDKQINENKKIKYGSL